MLSDYINGHDDLSSAESPEVCLWDYRPTSKDALCICRVASVMLITVVPVLKGLTRVTLIMFFTVTGNQHELKKCHTSRVVSKKRTYSYIPQQKESPQIPWSRRFVTKSSCNVEHFRAFMVALGCWRLD